MMTAGSPCILVLSGAVAAARNDVPSVRGVSKLERQKVLAAIGQPMVMNACREAFAPKGIGVAQILVTKDTFASRRQFFAVRDTLFALMANGFVAILNDNDVLHREDHLDFSDNDQLAALVGGMLKAEQVVLFTDEDGAYRRFPPTSPSDLIDEVIVGSSCFQELGRVMRGSGSGRGGMKAKLRAAQLLGWMGIPMTIVNGTQVGNLEGVVSGDVIATRFIPDTRKQLSGLQRWLLTGAVPDGTLKVSQGAARSMSSSDNRASLLAAGIRSSHGNFRRGDVVSVRDCSGVMIGFGMVRIDSADVTKALAQSNVIVIHADQYFSLQTG
jgi:glutamate 5-kinase